MTEEPKIVRCKPCGRRFGRLEWMTNKVCDNPNCSCPEVKKVAMQVNKAIDQAKQRAGFNVTRSVVPLPTRCNSKVDQYYIDMEPMVVYEIKKTKQNK